MFLYELGDDQSWISLKRIKSQKGRPKSSLVLHIGCLHFMFSKKSETVSFITTFVNEHYPIDKQIARVRSRIGCLMCQGGTTCLLT